MEEKVEETTQEEKGLEEEIYVSPDGDVYVDYDIVTFAQLELQIEAKEVIEEIGELTKAFQAIVNNIIDHRDITDKASAISLVATEYQTRVDAIVAGEKEIGEKERQVTEKPKPTEKGILEQVKEYFEPLMRVFRKNQNESFDIDSGIKTFETPDGEDWIIVWSTNAFMDREEEIFSTKAIDDFLERQSEKEVKGEFWFWHLPGAKYADIKLQGLAGRFLVEAGPFDHTDIGQGFKEFFEKYPDGHPIIAPQGWGASHGYKYLPEDRRDGVYEWFDKHESTVLPKELASNPHNPQLTTRSKEVVLMDEKTRKEWEQVFGEKLVEQIVTTGEQRTAELEAANVAFKGEVVDGEKADGNLQTALMAIANEMPESDEKSALVAMAETSEDISKQLKELAEKVQGDAGLKLLSLVETLPKAEKEEPKEDSTEEEKPEPEVTETPDYVTRDELKEVAEMLVVQLGTVITDAIKEVASKEELEESVNTLTDIVAQIAGKVKTLAASDEAKIAAKTVDTPAASLSEMLQSSLFSSKTQVDGRTSLAKDGPEEAESTKNGPSVQGVALQLWN